MAVSLNIPNTKKNNTLKAEEKARDFPGASFVRRCKSCAEVFFSYQPRNIYDGGGVKCEAADVDCRICTAATKRTWPQRA